MTRYQFSVTVTSSPQNLATLAFAGTSGSAYPNGWKQTYGTGYLSFNRLEAYMAEGSAGAGFIGPSTISGSNINTVGGYTLPVPQSSTNIGGYVLIQSYGEENVGDLSQYYIAGSNAGDVAIIVFHQL